MQNQKPSVYGPTQIKIYFGIFYQKLLNGLIEKNSNLCTEKIQSNSRYNFTDIPQIGIQNKISEMDFLLVLGGMGLF